ncbi:NAD(P)/FAD-dependent oxidoreductase [Thioclava sp.]|uniref:NAD(P)/FAD-dependent oxidoreductase n=1 Tax=Thioclava sp. TaxID=1933450 RepID=UPI003AA7AB93
MSHSGSSEIVIIGAGIIGVSTALALQNEGRKVRILERKSVAAEASRGNQGAFAYTDIEPLATPGIMRKAPKWLLDPLGPLSLRPAYALKIAPWMYHFWRATSKSRYAAAIKAQSDLMRLSQAALERLITATQGESFIRREGQLQVYEGAAQFQASLPSWELRRHHGIAFDLLKSPKEIAEIQPGLHRRFTHAGYTPTWMNAVDPALWTEYLAERFVKRGGTIEIADIHALSPIESGVEIKTAAGDIRAAQVVVAAGAWSHHLARTLGERIPLETERGYNTTFPTVNFDLKTHLTFSDHGFVISKIGDGLRVGGAVELGGLKLPPNYKRAKILVEKAKRFLDGFDPKGGIEWMGFRPSMPDSLPVISQSSITKQVIYAFGHGHLGLTQSAGTAELVCALAAGRDPEISLSPFDAARF